jgi:hypothetical protein
VWSLSLAVAVTSQFIYACALPACHAAELSPIRRYSADHDTHLSRVFLKISKVLTSEK